MSDHPGAIGDACLAAEHYPGSCNGRVPRERQRQRPSWRSRRRQRLREQAQNSSKPTPTRAELQRLVGRNRCAAAPARIGTRLGIKPPIAAQASSRFKVPAGGKFRPCGTSATAIAAAAPYHPGGAPTPSGRDIESMRKISVDEVYHCSSPLLVILGGNPQRHWSLSATLILDNVALRLMPKG